MLSEQSTKYMYSYSVAVRIICLVVLVYTLHNTVYREYASMVWSQCKL